ncbi:MAG TPA: cytochrome c [Caulobacteraceae bacterium]|nr:cytochrome c [Caulobacteraceae bacterium]
MAAGQAASSTDPAVARGAALSKLGGCQGCHTGEGGAPFAGGRPIGTPFGAVYSTNITPDPATGIGRWSEADFRRAIRDGVAPGGQQLYPAFPYDHFTRLTDQDIADLYAFLRSRDPVQAPAHPNKVEFPFNIRPLIGVWKALYFRHASVPNDPAQSAEWNRGRYLVLALGHCGGCHTPRNSLGAEHWDRELSGGWVDAWYAPPLDRASPAAKAWTVEALETYLRTGLSVDHAAAAGPMGGVTQELATAPPEDVHAMAVYIAAGIGTGADHMADNAAAAAARPEGARLFAGACANCHDAGAPMMNEGRPDLTLGSPLHETDPADTVLIILQGLKPPAERDGPSMPAYAAAFSDQQVAQIAGYLRARYTSDPPWPGELTRAVAKARKAAHG